MSNEQIELRHIYEQLRFSATQWDTVINLLTMQNLLLQSLLQQLAPTEDGLPAEMPSRHKLAQYGRLADVPRDPAVLQRLGLSVAEVSQLLAYLGEA